ncbi:hypothetical protein RHMOL_Rhmol09G0102300 [Rhododendron molle]|uniref:Uncharacterized protein n=1 Tax=Rhododendron molle TaxID=49168 RepID=A0ACC0MC56_RHOML|nr:hypothetical protein RHMOL_Rhmol09G0102300 [Rhododendron molle]
MSRQDRNLFDPRIKLKGVESSSQVSKLCYSTQSKFDDENTSQGPPTQTDLEETVDPSLPVINKDFEINFDKLFLKFKSKENKQKRKDYFTKCTSSKQDRILAQWENFMEESRTEINFFNYLENFYKKVNTITKKSDNTTVSTNHDKLGIKEFKKVNVITKNLPEEELLIDLISRIDDSKSKQKYISRLKKILVQKSQPINSIENFDEQTNKVHKEVTLQNLKQEVNLIKKDITKLDKSKETDKELHNQIKIVT